MGWDDLAIVLHQLERTERGDLPLPEEEYSTFLEGLTDSARHALFLRQQAAAALHFSHKLRVFMKWLTDPDGERPLGRVDDFFWRIEFQNRGSPHAHMLLWSSHADPTTGDMRPPRIDSTDPTEVARVPSFIDTFVSTCTPPVPGPDATADERLLYRLVTTVQQHAHRPTCRPLPGRPCRFNYPKMAPVPATRLRLPSDTGLRR